MFYPSSHVLRIRSTKHALYTPSYNLKFLPIYLPTTAYSLIKAPIYNAASKLQADHFVCPLFRHLLLLVNRYYFPKPSQVSTSFLFSVSHASLTNACPNASSSWYKCYT